MTQGEPKTLTSCHTWAGWNVRSMHCGACTRRVCLRATGWAWCLHSRRTHGCCDWLSAKPSLSSFCRRTIYKKTTQDDCQNSLFSKSLKFLMKPLLPVAWCSNELESAFQSCPICLPIIIPLIVLPIALVPWVPVWVQDGESHQLELWLQEEERDDGWSVKVGFSSAKFSSQFVLRPLEEPFCIRTKLIIQSLPGTCWDEFDSNIFSPLPPAYLSIHFSLPGSQVLTLNVVHSNFRQMLVDKDFDIGLTVLLLQCERCQSSQSVQDIVPRHQSIHGSFGSPFFLWIVFPSVRHWYTQHLLLWHGVLYGVGWMVAFIFKLFLNMTIEALNCQINSPMEHNE